MPERLKHLVGAWAVALLVICVGCATTPPPEIAPAPPSADQAAARLVVTPMSTGLPNHGMYRQNAVLADMNGDGVLDLVAPPPRKAPQAQAVPQVFLGDGKGGWQDVSHRMQYPEMIYRYGTVGVGDFDEDGLMDMVLAMHELGFCMLKRTGEWTWERVTEGLPSGEEYPTRCLRVADMNGDGHLDIVCAGELIGQGAYRRVRSWGILILEGDGQLHWKAHWVVDSTGIFADDLAVGDVNGDGILDIALASRNSTRKNVVWTGVGDLTFSTDPSEGLHEETAYDSVYLADVDGDGNDDLVAGVLRMNPYLPDPNGIRVYYRRGEAWQEDIRGLPMKPRFGGVYATDIDGDGRRDLIGIEYFTGVVRFFIQDPTGVMREVPKAIEPEHEARGYGLTVHPLGENAFLVVTVLSLIKDEGAGGGLYVYRVEWRQEDSQS